MTPRSGLRVPGGWDGFEVVVRAVLGQQISVAGATTLTQRLVRDYGGLRIDGRTGLDRCFPNSESLVDALMEKLGLPKARAETLRSLSRAVLVGRISFHAGRRLDEFVNNCNAIPGIGTWTAQYVAMRALSHPDAIPGGG